MLEIRPTCENCNKALTNHSIEAMICSYECTFCKDCVDNILFNVCPNCGGGFEKRSCRPQNQLTKFPPSKNIVYKPVSSNPFLKLNKHINPRER